MSIDRSTKDLRALLQAIESAGWDYARIELDDLTIVVSDGRASVEQSAPAESNTVQHFAEEDSVPEFAMTEATVSATESITGNFETVMSPTIGLFWRSPKPGAPPFVEEGQLVQADDTVCIIEVMKLMTHVKAGYSGTVTRIRATNGETVEFGTPLFDIAAS
jgi:acetyl-CoA carboxylase biotin carboxyl carrier protein